MKVVILAGGAGTRLSEYTHSIPKPMVKIGRYPIVVHIMNHYLKYGYNEFILATGYKSNIFKKFFKNYKRDGKKFFAKISGKKCIITIVDSGLSTMTGGRIKKIKKFVGKDQDFMFTYGDGVSDVNINELNDLKYGDINSWTSFGHMLLISSIEENFDIQFEPEDISELTSYKEGMNLLKKFNISFD